MVFCLLGYRGGSNSRSGESGLGIDNKGEEFKDRVGRERFSVRR